MGAVSPWQFAIFRIGLGCGLAACFACAPVTSLAVGLPAVSLLFAAGVWRRLAAALLAAGWTWLHGPGAPYVGWLLLACALVPEGEPAALKAWRPAERWEMPAWLWKGVFALLMVAYTAHGLWTAWHVGTHASPLAWTVLGPQVAAAPLALVPALRKWLWLALAGLQVFVVGPFGSADLALGMLAIHAFAFDGRWLAPRRVRGEAPIVFFDGVCGLCNRAVDAILRADERGVFRFAPLQGEAARERLPAELTRDVSTFVLLEDGRVHTRSDAAIGVATALGGVGRLAAVFRLVPRPVRDAVYAFVARNRYRWFGRHDTCRLPAPEERARFLD